MGQSARKAGARAMTAPILLVIFNRPDTTAQVMEAIRRARPARLYVAADGPRADRPGEAEKCAAARRIATQVDWPCAVHQLFRAQNLGCRAAVSGGVTWFFEHEPEGIILEDDIVPDDSFFAYCTELLARYRDAPKVMAITGLNLQPPDRSYAHSYYFSSYNHVWGWASWARAWALFDRTLEDLESAQTRAAIRAQSGRPGFEYYWLSRFRKVRYGDTSSWAYPWLLSGWKAGGLTCTPRVNLIRNVGFGDGATHTSNIHDNPAALIPGTLGFPLSHPDRVERSPENDDYVTLHEYGVCPPKPDRRLKNWLRKRRWEAGRG